MIKNQQKRHVCEKMQSYDRMSTSEKGGKEMENFTFQCATKIIFGRDSESQLQEELQHYGKRVLFHHYGDGVIEKIGLYDKVMSILKKAGAEVYELSGVQPNPRLSLAKEGIRICKEKKIDLILAVGGGSVIDSAKTIALGAKYQGDVWDFYKGTAEPKDVLPLGVVLTIPATGSEASDGAVITNEDGMLKRPMHSQLIRPKFSILNPEVTFSLPRFQTAAGAFDIMSHVMERYFTTTTDVELTDHLCEAVMRTVKNNLEKVVKEPKNYEARANIMWSGTLAHNDLLGTGRSEDWASHMIGHELSAMFNLTHGATLSIVTPAWMRYVYKKHLNRFIQFAVRVWNVEEDYDHPEETALRGIEEMEKFAKRMGLPIRLSECEIYESKIEELAEKCTKDGTVGGLEILNKEDVIRILELAK